MTKLIAGLATMVALLASPAALARPHHPPPRPHHAPIFAPAGVTVDNDAGVTVDLYVDGAWRGTVHPGDARVFSTLPGRRNVQVRAHDLGVVLYEDRHHLRSGEPCPVRVVPPITRVTLRNRGGAPLFATLSGSAESFWLLPGQHRAVNVQGFQSVVTTSLYTRHGLMPIDSDVLRLTTGRPVTKNLGFTATAPVSQVSVTNHERRTVRIYVAGRQVAAVPPRSTRQFEAVAGRHVVTVAEEGGRVLYNEATDFLPGSQHTVELRNGLHVASDPGPTAGLLAYN